MEKDKKHRKHSNLERPKVGRFGRLEWAIIGAPCSDIQGLGLALAASLQPHQVAWVDADHNAFDAVNEGSESPFALTYTDFFKYQNVAAKFDENPFSQRAPFQEIDIVLVNGNHFEAARQIVLLNPKKEASLKKRLDQLTQIDALVLMSEDAVVFDFLKEKINPDTPIFYKIQAKNAIQKLVLEKIEAEKPPLYGLVLAGGKSQRMGFDKTQINYHGKAQALHMAEMLQALCSTTYISTREGKGHAWEIDFPALQDTFTGLGPFGGIVSAFRKHPNAAWLVVASDLPFLNAETLEFLIENRNTASIASTFRSPIVEKNGMRFPEPLITIWEPKAYPKLLNMLAQGYSCPRKVLINSNTHIIEVPDKQALTNVNYPEEYQKVKAEL